MSSAQAVFQNKRNYDSHEEYLLALKKSLNIDHKFQEPQNDIDSLVFDSMVDLNHNTIYLDILDKLITSEADYYCSKVGWKSKSNQSGKTCFVTPIRCNLCDNCKSYKTQELRKKIVEKFKERSNKQYNGFVDPENLYKIEFEASELKADQITKKLRHLINLGENFDLLLYMTKQKIGHLVYLIEGDLNLELLDIGLDLVTIEKISVENIVDLFSEYCTSFEESDYCGPIKPTYRFLGKFYGQYKEYTVENGAKIYSEAQKTLDILEVQEKEKLKIRKEKLCECGDYDVDHAISKKLLFRDDFLCMVPANHFVADYVRLKGQYYPDVIKEELQEEQKKKNAEMQKTYREMI